MSSSITPNFVKPWLPKTAPPKLLLKNGSVVDVADGRLLKDCAVLLEDGVITKIYDHAAEMDKLEQVQEIDLEGRFICPGLIDCHVHVSAVPGEIDLQQVLATPEQEALLRMTFVCRDILCRGFTTVRDCGGAPYALKQACNDWLVIGPRLFISGHALSQTGGHGDFRSAHDHKDCAAGFVSGLGRLCDGVPECMRIARDELRRGADFIKIMGSGGVASPNDTLDSIQFSPEEIRAIVTVAENAHTYVTSHSYTSESVRMAIENGVKGIEHGNLIDRSTAKLMAQKGCFLTQTLVTYHTIADPSMPRILPPDGEAKNKEVLKAGLDALRIARDEGVTLCYGSDLLGPFGFNQCKGFSLCSEALSPVEILQSATTNAAKLLRQNDLGQIKEGFVADVLILNTNPLEDITSLEHHETNIAAVVKGGRICLSRMPGISGLLDGLRNL